MRKSGFIGLASLLVQGTLLAQPNPPARGEAPGPATAAVPTDEARLRQVTADVQALQNRLAEAKEQLRASLPPNLKDKPDPALQSAWEAWKKAATELETAVDEDAPDEKVAELQATASTAGTKLSDERHRVYGAFDKKMRECHLILDQLKQARLDQAKLEVSVKYGTSLRDRETEWRARLVDAETRKAKAAAELHRTEAAEEQKVSSAAKEVDAVEEERAKKIAAVNDEAGRQQVDTAMNPRIAAARKTLEETIASSEKARKAADDKFQAEVTSIEEAMSKFQVEMSTLQATASRDFHEADAQAQKESAIRRREIVVFRDQLLGWEAARRKEEEDLQSRIWGQRPMASGMAQRRLPDLAFNGNAFEDVIDFYRDVSGLNIFVDGPALSAAGIALDSPITYKATNTRFIDAMNAVISQPTNKQGQHPLELWTRGRILVITTASGREIWQKRMDRLRELRKDPAARAILNRNLPEIRLNGNSLSDVIDFMNDVSGTKFEVDWTAVTNAGGGKDTPVSCRLRDIPVGEVCVAILTSAGVKPDLLIGCDGKSLYIGKVPSGPRQ